MDSSVSSEPGFTRLAGTVNTSVKVIIAGRFGVGKTTMIGNVSEITPLTTEADMTQYSTGVDDLKDSTDKTTTTVAMDFGRLTIDNEIVLYLFGAPGQPRFAPFISNLMIGALGGVVLADTRQLVDSFASTSRFERAGLPFVVAFNAFDDAPTYPEKEIREALAITPDTPIVTCDVRDPASARSVLIALVRHLIARNDLERS